MQSLLALTPDRASVLQADGSEVVVEATQLRVGDPVLVRPGERVGADGTVVAGSSEVDQASITGEPLPVLKELDDDVYAGTLNGVGTLRVRVRVDRPAADSLMSRIVALVEQASATKAERQLFIERVEQRYSVAVVAATLALVAVPLALGTAFEPILLRVWLPRLSGPVSTRWHGPSCSPPGSAACGSHRPRSSPRRGVAVWRPPWTAVVCGWGPRAFSVSTARRISRRRRRLGSWWGRRERRSRDGRRPPQCRDR